MPICSDCGSQVASGYWRKHEEWHLVLTQKLGLKTESISRPKPIEREPGDA